MESLRSVPARRRARTRVRLAVRALAVSAVSAVPLASVAPATALAAAPAVTAISPDHGPVIGRNPVRIVGLGLGATTEVWFGDKLASLYGVNARSIEVFAPEGAAGTTVQVRARSSEGESAAFSYTYDGRRQFPLTVDPATGPVEGGNTVTVGAPAGADLSETARVRFGGLEARVVTRSERAVTVVAPGGRPGSRAWVDVRSESGHVDGDGQLYTYGPTTEPPVVTGLTPAVGHARGWQRVRIDGRGLEGIGEVEVGGIPTIARTVVATPGERGSLEIQTLEGAPGTVDVRVTSPFGTSPNTPADDFTYLPDGPKPVIESISPTSGPMRGGEVVTLRGRNLGKLSSAGWTETSVPVDPERGRVLSFSDTEVRVLTPVFAKAGPVAPWASTADGGLSDRAPDLVYEVTPPRPLTISPAVGPVRGGNLVTFTSDDVAMDLVTRVEFGGFSMPVMSWTPTSVTAIAPRAFAGTSPVVLRGSGNNAVRQFNGALDTYTWKDAPPTTKRALAARGTASLARFTYRPGPLTGSFELGLGAPDGSLSVTPTFGDLQARLTALTMIPVTARIGFVPSGAATAAWLDDGSFSMGVSVRIKVRDVKLFGAIPLAGGSACQTRELTRLGLRSSPEFDPAVGGTLTSTFSMSDLNGCGILNGLVSPATASAANKLELALTPIEG